MPWWEMFRADTIGAAPVPSTGAAPRAADSEPGASLQDWQRQAWAYYQELGEIHYAGSFYARMLTGVRLLIQELVDLPPEPGALPTDPDNPAPDAPAPEWQESNDPDLNDVLSALENSRGGLAQLQGDFGRLYFVQGEAQLCRTLLAAADATGGDVQLDVNGDEYVELWEMLSAEELAYNKEEKTYRRRRSGTGASADERVRETDLNEPVVGTMMAWRFYHRDPQFSGMADSSMRAVLDDCEELLLLKQSIRNTARNRGAGNGIMVMPSGMGTTMVDMGDGTMIPKTAKDIYEALNRPIHDEKAASAVSPVIIFAPPGTTSADVFHLDIRGAALYRETGLRDECIHRIAIGLDMPPEELTGVASANHWTAWQIDEAKWTSHGAPIAMELCGQLTAALIAPMCRDLGKDPRRVRIWYDATAVVQDPDRGRAAKEAHNLLAISDEAYRRETGWEEEDAPDEEEYERRAKLKSAPSAQPPTAEPSAGATTGQIIGMAEACVLRCRELAGSKLRTRLQANGTPANLRVRIKAAANSEVAARLGVDARPLCNADALVAGAGQVFLTGMIRMGLDPSLAERLVRVTEEHAARTLFDDDPGELPDEALAICGLAASRA